jgi:hypothetical protein
MRRTKLGALLAAGLTVLAIGAVTDTHPMLLGGKQADAVIGRPLTPMSYAGVARRTTRRAAYAGAYAGGYGYGYAAPVVPAATVVTSPPAGCAQVISGGVATYNCGATTYHPAYHGTTVVYRSM